MIEFPAGINRSVSAYLKTPLLGGGPRLVLIHAWWGLTGFMKGVCDRLAGEGYTVLAPDLYGGKTAATVAEAESLANSLPSEDVIGALDGAIETLRAHPSAGGRKMGVIGFSMGGALALLLAARLKPDDLAAAVTFYGMDTGLKQPDYERCRTAFQGHFVENDPYEPAEAVRSVEEIIRQAGRPVAFHFYPDAGHWFFESDRPEAYHSESASLAWQRTLAFLKQRLSED